MVKDHSNSKKETTTRYFFQLAARCLLYAQPTDSIVHAMAFVTPIVDH